VEQATQLEMSHALMVTKRIQMNVKSRDLLNISNVKIKVIAVGDLENGRIVHVLDSRNVKSHVGMDLKIQYQMFVQFLIDQIHEEIVQLHQTVNIFYFRHFLMNKNFYSFLIENINPLRFMQKYSTLSTNKKRWRI
jgi:hypothetical protein